MKLDDLVLCTYTYFTTPRPDRDRRVTVYGFLPMTATVRPAARRREKIVSAKSAARQPLAQPLTQRFQRVMDAQALAQRTLRPLSVGRAVGCPAEGAVKERAVSVRAVGKAAVEWVRGA